MGDGDLEDESYKWMPSKMRILRKMMMSSSELSSYEESPQKSEDKKQFLSTKRRASYNDMISDSVRVCANCNTTKTPLWRSGPRGPKVLTTIYIVFLQTWVDVKFCKFTNFGAEIQVFFCSHFATPVESGRGKLDGLWQLQQLPQMVRLFQ